MSYCRKHGIELYLSEVREQPRKALERSGFVGAQGPGRIVSSPEEALEALQQSRS